jgi:acyl-phosphate glycerol 3-phosphate acyltransferase
VADTIASVLVIAGSYLLGALPSAYLLARVVKGIDIREYGSGNVGIANVSVHVGERWMAPLILFDVFAKGILPVAVASDHILGLGLWVEAGAGMASVLGHNWSVWLKFTGGRGMATALGVVAALHYPLVLVYGGQAAMAWLGAKGRRNPLYLTAGAALISLYGYWIHSREKPLWAVLSACGFLFALLVFYAALASIPRLQARATDSALWWGLAALLLPVWSAVFEQPVAFTAFCCLFLGVTAVKRLSSNRGTARADESQRVGSFKLVWNRLVFDRDIDDRSAWVRRGPSDGDSGAGPAGAGRQRKPRPMVDPAQQRRLCRCAANVRRRPRAVAPIGLNDAAGIWRQGAGVANRETAP